MMTVGCKQAQRVAAMGVTSCTAVEVGNTVGYEVGYSITRFEQVTSP